MHSGQPRPDVAEAETKAGNHTLRVEGGSKEGLWLDSTNELFSAVHLTKS